MKRILSTALAVVLFIGAAQAQSTEKGDRRHKGERNEMAMNHLNLTTDQKAKFQSLRETQRKEMKELRKSGNVSPEQRKALHQKYTTQYQAILTPAQQEELKKNKEEWKSKDRKGKRGSLSGNRGGDFGRQAAFFKKELNLTTSQETKLKSIFQAFRTKSQELRSNTSLSKDQKRSQLQSLAQQYMAQGRAVLTPEQLKKFDEIKGKRKGKKGLDV